MKAYKDYMNRVTGGDRLREKIMARIAVPPCDAKDEAVTHIMSTLYVPPRLSETGEHAERWISQDNISVNTKAKRLKIATARLQAKKQKNRPFSNLIAMVSWAAVLVVAIFAITTTINRPAVIIPDEEVAVAGLDSFEIEYYPFDAIPEIPVYNTTYYLIFNVTQAPRYRLFMEH